MLAIIGASGKIGGATLSTLLSYRLAEASSIVAIISSSSGSSTWESLAAKGVEVRHGDFEDQSTLKAALRGCAKFCLVSKPRIELDFHDAPEGKGRERHHKTAIDAVVKAGVQHLYYFSLVFRSPSKAAVMSAHLRTEAYLASLSGQMKVTVIREGLYNESWPLYLGYYKPKTDQRETVLLLGNGKVSWTALEDLGLSNALVLTSPSEQYTGKTFYLSTPPERAVDLKEVAAAVAETRGQPVSVRIVDRGEHEPAYVGQGLVEAAAYEWWASTYEALKDGEAVIDDPTLMELLSRHNKKPVSVQHTIKDMISS